MKPTKDNMKFLQSMTNDFHPQPADIPQPPPEESKQLLQKEVKTNENNIMNNEGEKLQSVSREDSIEIKDNLSLSIVNLQIQSFDSSDAIESRSQKTSPKPEQKDPSNSALIQLSEIHVGTLGGVNDEEDDEGDEEAEKEQEDEPEEGEEAREETSGKEEDKKEGEMSPSDLSKAIIALRPKNSPIKESVHDDNNFLEKPLLEKHTSLLDVKYGADGSKIIGRNDSKDLSEYDDDVLNLSHHPTIAMTTEEQIKTFFLNLKGISAQDVEDKMDGISDLSNPEIATIFCDSITQCLKDQSHQARIAIFYSIDLFILALEQHQENEELVKKLCFTIRDLTAVNSISQIKFGNKEGCGKLFAFLLQLYLRNLEITILLSEVIRNIVIKEQGKVQFGKEGCCEALTSALYGYVQNPDAVLLICGAILNISANSIENKRVLGEAGCCEPLVEVLLLHMSNAAVIKIVCGAIQNLSVYDENKKRFGEHGCCEALIYILLIYIENPVITWEIFGAIRNMTLDEKNLELFESIGTLELFTKSLIMHMGNGEVTKQICGALRRMISFQQLRPRALPNLPLIKQVWGKKLPLYERYCRIYNEEIIVETLIDTLSKYTTSIGGKVVSGNTGKTASPPQSLDVAKEICSTIKAMAFNQFYYNRFDLENTIQILLNVLVFQTNPSNVFTLFKNENIGEIVKETCGAINGLARTVPTKQRFYEDGACPIFANIIKQHIESLTTNPPLSSTSLASTSGDEKAAAAANTASMEIIREMSRIIKNFGLHEESKTQLGELGICSLLVQAIDLFLGNNETISIVCGAILNLSANHRENKIKFTEAGVCERLVQVVMINLANEEILKQACCAMKNLSVSDVNKRLFGELGACDVLVAAITTHLYHQDLLIDILEPMWNISIFMKNQIIVSEIGGCEILLEAFAIYLLSSGRRSLKNPSSAAATAAAAGETGEPTNSPPATSTTAVIAATSFANATHIQIPPTKSTITTTTSPTTGTTKTTTRLTKVKHILKLLLGILKTLSKTPMNHPKIGSIKGCELLLKLFHKYSTNNELLKSALQLFGSLVSHEEVKKNYGQVKGASEKVLLLFLSKQIDTEMIVYLCQILQYLVIGGGNSYNKINANKLYASGCCEMLTEITRRLPKIVRTEIERKYPINQETGGNNGIVVPIPSNDSLGPLFQSRSISGDIGRTESSRIVSLTSVSSAGYQLGSESADIPLPHHLSIEEGGGGGGGGSATEQPEGENEVEKEEDDGVRKTSVSIDPSDVPILRRDSTSSVLTTGTARTITNNTNNNNNNNNTSELTPEKRIELKLQEMKKIIKSLADKLSSKDTQFKKRFEDVGISKYLQESNHPAHQNSSDLIQRSFSGTGKSEDAPSGPAHLRSPSLSSSFNNVMEKYQKRQKLAEKRFDGTNILL